MTDRQLKFRIFIWYMTALLSIMQYIGCPIKDGFRDKYTEFTDEAFLKIKEECENESNL